MIRISLIAGLVLLISCVPAGVTQNDLTQIRQLLDQQQDAWNRGDIDAFMKTYSKSDSLVFYGSGGATYGWIETLQNYKRRYPSLKEMGKLTFEVAHLTPVEGTSALLMGTFHLEREMGNLSGYYTLVWKKVGKSWKIIADMTCAQ